MSDLYILRNANLITMENDQVLYNMDLFVANGKIYKIATPHRHLRCAGQGLFGEISDAGPVRLPRPYGLRRHHRDAHRLWRDHLPEHVGFPETQQWRGEIDAGIRPGPHVYSTGPLTDGVTYWEGSKIVTTPEEGHGPCSSASRAAMSM